MHPVAPLATLLLLLPALASAEERITPKLLDAAVAIEPMIAAAQAHAEVNLEGNGDTLILSYESPVPMSGFLLFLNEDGSFDPLASLVVRLPPGRHDDLALPIASSPAWEPGRRAYRFHLLLDEEVKPRITRIALQRRASLPVIALTQLSQAEPILPSSAHRLRGYRVFGTPLLPVLALILALAFLVPFCRRNFPTLLLATVLLVHARFAADITRTTQRHLADWYGRHTYAEAGSLYAIAETLADAKADSVLLCSGGTTYAEVLLRYLVYPASLSPLSPAGGDETFPEESSIVVHNALDWSYEDGILRCGDRSFAARELRSFADGSSVFARTQ